MGVRQSIDTGLRTLVCLIVLPASVVVYGLRAIILSLRGAPLRRVDRVYNAFAGFCVRVAGTTVEAHGFENIEPGRAYVIVANHESSWDPLALMSVLKQLSVRFIAKKALMQIPIFGNALRASGNVTVVRTNTLGDVQRIQQGMHERDPNVSILFYAEGTRARDGSLRPFKKGAFTTAVSEGLSILPVATAGTYPIWTPETIRIRKGTVVIEMGQPISVEGLPLEARDKLREQTETAVRQLRARARRRLRALGLDPGGVD
jgi:1-acyl-sn-glycerol-3-phosphate acyltransferase